MKKFLVLGLLGLLAFNACDNGLQPSEIKEAQVNADRSTTEFCLTYDQPSASIFFRNGKRLDIGSLKADVSNYEVHSDHIRINVFWRSDYANIIHWLNDNGFVRYGCRYHLIGDNTIDIPRDWLIGVGRTPGNGLGYVDVRMKGSKKIVMYSNAFGMLADNDKIRVSQSLGNFVDLNTADIDLFMSEIR